MEPEFEFGVDSRSEASLSQIWASSLQKESTSLSTVGSVHYKAIEFRISCICHIFQLKVNFLLVMEAQIQLIFVIVDL